MDKEFFIGKIEKLSDDTLKELLKMRMKSNAEILKLAENEATKRGIDTAAIPMNPNRARPSKPKSNGDDEIDWLAILGFFVP